MKPNRIFEYIALRKICLDLQDQITILEYQDGDQGVISHLEETYSEIHESAVKIADELEIKVFPLT